QWTGAGAAGGLCGGLFGVLRSCGVKISVKNGIDYILERIGLSEKIKNCDLVITGEGQVDKQTKWGKAASGVVQMAKKQYGIASIVVVGSIGQGAFGLREEFGCEIFSIMEKPVSLEEAMDNAEELLHKGARRLFGIIQIGYKMNEKK
ncbi:MAG: putative glycerate kinase, partial [Streblomastix strix]